MHINILIHNKIHTHAHIQIRTQTYACTNTHPDKPCKQNLQRRTLTVSSQPPDTALPCSPSSDAKVACMSHPCTAACV